MICCDFKLRRGRYIATNPGCGSGEVGFAAAHLRDCLEGDFLDEVDEGMDKVKSAAPTALVSPEEEKQKARF